jgi:hypothetical protein
MNISQQEIGIEDVVEQPVEFLLHLAEGGSIRCKASYDICERLFCWKLEYAPRVIHNLNRGDYTVWRWIEKEPAIIPVGLDQYVARIELERKIYLTD